MAHRIGVCSWSLQPKSPADLAEKIRATGLACVQLHLDPLVNGSWSTEDTIDRLTSAGITVISGMMTTKGEDYSTLESIKRTGGIRPDHHWPSNLAAAVGVAALSQRLGIRLVSFHAGFIPEETHGAERRRMLERLRLLIDVFASFDVRLAFETGQETATTLLEVLEALERPSAGINFDPANMILYGMGDPVAALEHLAPWVRQFHIKDARPSSVEGQWGTEVPAGNGAVDWRRFFDVIRAGGIARDFMIERESGEQRITDIRRAASIVRDHSEVS